MRPFHDVDQGQGGGQSIEDGAALGILLSHMKCADAADIEARLKLFESVRKDRGAAMQIFSNAGQDEGEKIREAARPYVNGHIPSKCPPMSIIYNAPN